MESKISLPRSPTDKQWPTTNEEATLSDYGTDYQQPRANPGVMLSVSTPQHLTKTLIWVLCALLGATACVHGLSKYTLAWYLLVMSTDDTWGGGSTIASVDYGKPIVVAFGTLIFSRLADVCSRPTSSVVALLAFILGSVTVAMATNLPVFVVGIIIHAIGTSGISLLVTLFIADCTSLKWRGLGLSWMYFPYIINMWIIRQIEKVISWRWAYGMFVIIIPVLCIPALAILFLARSRQEAKMAQIPRTKLGHSLLKLDPLGLWFFVTGFGLVMYSAGYWWVESANRWTRTMLPIGFVLLVPCFFTWEFLYAPFPLVPKNIINTRPVKCAVFGAFFYRVANSLMFSSFNRFLNTRNWEPQLFIYFFESLSMAYSVFALVFGTVFLLTKSYKSSLLAANGLFILGTGLLIQCARIAHPPDLFPSSGLIFAAQVIRGIGSIGIELGLAVGSQASVSHDDLATTIALMIALPSLGDMIGDPVSYAVYFSNASTHSSYVILFTLALTFALFSFIFSLPMPDYALESAHNMVEEEGCKDMNMSSIGGAHLAG